MKPGADGHGHDETYLECGVLYEGVALFVVDAEVVAAANDTSLRCLYQAEHVLRAFVIGGKVVGGGTVATDAQLGAHPYPSFTVAVYHFDEIVAQRVGVLVVVEVGVHLVAVVAHQSVACSYPDVAFLVLCHGLHLLMRQTVLTAEVAETIVGRSTECENTEIKESKNGQETFHLAKCFLLLRMYDGVGGHARHIALELHGADVHATGGYHRFGVVGMEDDAQSSLQAVRRARAALATQHTRQSRAICLIFILMFLFITFVIVLLLQTQFSFLNSRGSTSPRRARCPSPWGCLRGCRR